MIIRGTGVRSIKASAGSLWVETWRDRHLDQSLSAMIAARGITGSVQQASLTTYEEYYAYDNQVWRPGRNRRARVDAHDAEHRNRCPFHSRGPYKLPKHVGRTAGNRRRADRRTASGLGYCSRRVTATSS
jgi:hypothetical protein